MQEAEKTYTLWKAQLQDNPVYVKELAAIAGNKDEITDRFHMDLQFGTGGLRGILGLGTNRMNIFTVGRATQGLADYLNETCTNPSAAIAYDSRNFSEEFARHAATIFAANGITAHLYPTLVPTPALSYAVRELGCDSGINITASHNPAIYNGYKVYGADGCQLNTEDSAAVMIRMERTDLFTDVKTMDYNDALEQKLIKQIPPEFLDQFIARVLQESLRPKVYEKANLKIVYTPLNGAGSYSVQKVLRDAGVKQLFVVPEQEHPDGNFPTAPYPNPEMKEALTLGLALSEEKAADLLIATDPDSDRLGVAVRHHGSYRILTGTEVGLLLLDYIINSRTALGTMPKRPLVITTIVTSKMTQAIGKKAGVTVRSTLTGFKYICGIVREEEEKGNVDDFIFGYEESCGYLSGTYVRDKDAVNAALLTVEMASAYALEGNTLVDALEALEQEHGIYSSYTQNVQFDGVDGMDTMTSIMDTLRKTPPTAVAGEPVTAYLDYENATRYEGTTQATFDTPFSNVLEFELGDHGSIIIRPSGTEPKIKIYFLLRGTDHATVSALEATYITAFCKLIGVTV